jgi:hypothetical protein
LLTSCRSVVAVKGEEGRMHDFENAGQQGRGFERAHALLLQQVGEGVDLPGQFADASWRRLRARGKE